MNPLFQKWAGTIVRSMLLLTVGAWAASNNLWTEAEAEQYITAFVGVVVPMAWSLYDKYKSEQKQNTTIAVLNRLTGPTVDNVTVSDIEDAIKKGDVASAKTPKDEAPKLLGTGDGMRLIRSITGTGDGR